MKKVCFFIGNLNLTGGTERVTSVLADILYKNGYDISILSIYDGLNPAFEISEGIKLFQLFNQKVSMKAKFLTSILNLRSFIKDNKIETLIVVDSISCIFTVPALIGLDVKHICWEHFNFKFNFGSRFRNFGRKIATKYCDYVVTLTLKDGTDWRNFYKNTKAQIVTIYNPSPYMVQNVSLNKKSKTVLYVGRLSKEKGVDLLLDAWAISIKTHPDWHLKILGTGLEGDYLKQKCKELDIQSSVTFLGEQKNLQPYYTEAKFLCLPSREEGFGMVIVEAHAFGLPVLSFDIETGPKELIVEGTGFLVAPYDIELFSNNILKIINMSDLEYQYFSLTCKKNMLKFSKETILNHWKEIL